MPENQYILADFPENYELYEHCRTTTPRSSRSKVEKINKVDESSKGMEIDPPAAKQRKEVYLYGHPGGRKNRYRSPSDFLPHLLWLATDETGDKKNCTCKLCVPDELYNAYLKLSKLQTEQKDNQPQQRSMNGMEKIGTIKKENASVKETASPKGESSLHENQIPRALPIVAVPRRSSVASEKSSKATPKIDIKSSASPALVKLPQPSVPIQSMSSPLAAPKNSEQALDFQSNKFLYRPGELVWFRRGTAWGLAVIVNRTLFKDQRHRDCPEYTVQPLSHPYLHPAQMTISSEDALRPWLAWSAPTPTHSQLANALLSFEKVNWKAVIEGRYGPGDAEVDGSIFAAKGIDNSYTPIEPLGTTTAAAVESHYTGIYSGGEKIWVGEPVRLRINTGHDIMVVHHIIEKSSLGPNNAIIQDIHLIGDIYTFTTIPYNPARTPPINSHLPLRLIEDLNYRNRATVNQKSQISFWKLIQPQARLGLKDVKGRWYESRVLLPILHGQDNFLLAYRKGEIGDVGAWMNGRGDCNGSANKLGKKKLDRMDAFGEAVPPGTRISRGLDEQSAFPVDPALTSGSMAMDVDGGNGNGRQIVGHGGTDADIAEFVDVDQMDESYGQGYEGGPGVY